MEEPLGACKENSLVSFLRLMISMMFLLEHLAWLAVPEVHLDCQRYSLCFLSWVGARILCPYCSEKEQLQATI